MKKETARKSLKTAIYVRVSTEEQAQEGFSIRAQTDKLKAYACLKDWDIYNIYSDEGISGKNIVDRPAINRLIDDINAGNVENVLVFKVDRLTRSTKNLLELVELFEKSDCAFNSLTESIDTDTPSGRMFLKIIGIFAEFERENLVSRLKLGFERKAKEGYTLANGSMSYGYSKEKGQKIQTILEGEAKIVKEIFAMYVDENMTIRGIAKTLNQRKIPTKTGISSWNDRTIKGILTNPTYIGKVRYSLADERRYFEAEGQHERLLDDEIFNQAQTKLANMPKISRTKRPKESSYFCGILACAYCESKFTTHNYSNKADENKCMYRCVKNVDMSGKNECTAPRISHNKMNDAFVECIRNIADFAEIEAVDIENDRTKKEQELQAQIMEFELKIAKLDDRKKRITEQYVSEEISFEEYKSMLGVFDDKYEGLTAELGRAMAELPAVKSTPDIAHEDIIANLETNWGNMNNAEKMAFLQRFIKRIVISVEKINPTKNSVKIEKIEFNDVSAPVLEKGRGKSGAVRAKLGGMQR